MSRDLEQLDQNIIWRMSDAWGMKPVFLIVHISNRTRASVTRLQVLSARPGHLVSTKTVFKTQKSVFTVETLQHQAMCMLEAIQSVTMAGTMLMPMLSADLSASLVLQTSPSRVSLVSLTPTSSMLMWTAEEMRIVCLNVLKV